jgi:predicted alpha/beta-fold hydrolase
VTPFVPSLLLRHAQLQSMLASKSPRRRLWLRRGSQMEARAQALILDAGDGVQLSAFLTRSEPSAGLVALIHGWEGSHESTYLYSMACALHAAGYSVLRLNLRDHGGTQHLNREVFHSARIAEVIGAIAAAQALLQAQPLTVIGFSLGGNFALRVGIFGPQYGLKPSLSVGICPSINPRATIEAIDTGPRLLRRYFMDKWRKSVHAKAAAWPEYASFVARYLEPDSLLEVTARFAVDQTEYGSLEAYLAAYTLTPAMLMEASSPLAILTAADDPVIPATDFAPLREQGSLRRLDITSHGGHCGFIENLRMQTWSERHLLSLLRASI